MATDSPEKATHNRLSNPFDIAEKYPSNSGAFGGFPSGLRGLWGCLPKMSAAKDGRRQAHMDVLVAVPGKGRLPHSTRQLSRLEGPEPLNQSIILLNSANSDSQKFANSGLIEVPDDNTLLPQAFGQNLARLIFMTGKDEVCLGG